MSRWPSHHEIRVRVAGFVLRMLRRDMDDRDLAIDWKMVESAALVLVGEQFKIKEGDPLPGGDPFTVMVRSGTLRPVEVCPCCRAHVRMLADYGSTEHWRYSVQHTESMARKALRGGSDMTRGGRWVWYRDAELPADARRAVELTIAAERERVGAVLLRARRAGAAAADRAVALDWLTERGVPLPKDITTWEDA